jgi:two-component system, LytTR family, sensor kinase
MTVWYRTKWVTYIVHISLWVLLFFLPFVLRPTLEANKQPLHPQNFYFVYGINFLTYVAVFYLNASLLIPRFVNHHQYKTYFLSLILLTGVLLLINWGSFHLLFPELKYQLKGFLFFYMFPCLFFLAISTAYKMVQDRIRHEKETKEKETENLKTELSFLRSQVSPHFMFNVLNNMVALARKKSDILEPSLIKLSSLLRYMLYETVDENVPLEKEIEYLQSYIDLQQQRFGKNLHVETCFNNADKSYFIQPMLLIPFVENAFKHGTGIINDPFIHIKLKVEQSVLKFQVSNRFNEGSKEIKDKSSGIGLANVLRRLELLYGSQHQIKIEKENSIYSVFLQINLN